MQNELVEKVRDAIVDASGCDWDDVFAENLARAAIEAYDSAMEEEIIANLEWLLGIAAGVVEMGDQGYERAVALYATLTSKGE
jgi:hypothetical protein